MGEISVEKACEILHQEYERAAQAAGWSSNPITTVPWAQVPEAIKVARRASVVGLFAYLGVERWVD